MGSTSKLALAALGTLVFAGGCDLGLVPDTASYDGDATPRLGVVVTGTAMPSGEVEAVDLELVEVLVHRESDDQWVWIGGESSRVELSPTETMDGTPVPLHADYYDRVLIVLDTPRVASQGRWHLAEFSGEEIELPLNADLDGDSTLELHFDVAQSLRGSHGKAWQFAPSFRVEFTAH